MFSYFPDDVRYHAEDLKVVAARDFDRLIFVVRGDESQFRTLNENFDRETAIDRSQNFIAGTGLQIAVDDEQIALINFRFHLIADRANIENAVAPVRQILIKIK